jgi:hypothetical protein
VYNKSRLDLVEGGRELSITQACTGEYLCKVILSSCPFNLQVYYGSPQDLSMGGRQLIIRCAEWVVRDEFTCPEDLEYPTHCTSAK